MYNILTSQKSETGMLKENNYIISHIQIEENWKGKSQNFDL